MNFWPFPLLRNYGTDPAVTRVFDAFASSEALRVMTADCHRTEVSCELGRLQFWSANKYYAYGSEGTFVAKSGERYEWRNAMPGRAAVRRMANAVGSSLVRLPTRAQLETMK